MQSTNGTAKPYQISLADLNAAIAELPVYRQQNYKTRADKAEYLEELIEERLKIHRAMRTTRLINCPNTSRKLEDYTNQLMVEKLTEMQKLMPKVSYITDDDLMAHYQANLERVH